MINTNTNEARQNKSRTEGGRKGNCDGGGGKGEGRGGTHGFVRADCVTPGIAFACLPYFTVTSAAPRGKVTPDASGSQADDNTAARVVSQRRRSNLKKS